MTGNVTGSGTGTFAATIANDAVTYAKIQNVSATDRLLGRATAGAGDVEELPLTAAGRALLDDADAAAQRTTLSLGNVENTALSTWAGTANLTTLGTIGTGTWNATAITDAKIAAALTGKSYAGSTVTMTGAITSSGGGVGYATGAGGTVTQATSKATGVTLSKLCGDITLNAAALAAAAIVSFTLTNTTIAAADVLVLNHVTTGTRGGYGLNAQAAAGSALIYVRNNTAASLAEAIVIRFCVVKGALS